MDRTDQSRNQEQRARAPSDPLCESVLPLPKTVDFINVAVLKGKTFSREHRKNPKLKPPPGTSGSWFQGRAGE